VIVLQTKIKPVSGNQRLGARAVRKGAKTIGPAGKRFTLSSRYRKAKENLWLSFRAQYNGPLLQGPLKVSIWTPFHRADNDAHVKILFDCLEGVAYKNDRQIREHHVYPSPDDWLVIEVAPFVAVGRECPKSTHGVWA
jgi:Holliday junction resolvase RusA-like endonuclease